MRTFTRCFAISIGMFLLGGGCQSAHVSKPIAAKLYANDANAQMEFWHTLADQKVTSNDEAFHGLLLYLDQKDPATNYADRVKALKGRGLIPAGFDRPADEAVTRGTLAVAFCKILKVRGGVMMMVTGDHPRYATRELQYMGVFPLSSPQQTFSGTEYVGVIGKLDDVQNGVPAPVTTRLKE